jgi:chromosome segregation ATPase
MPSASKDTPAETGRTHDRIDYFGIRSLVAALHVRAISLPVIVPLVHSRADRQLKARSAGQLVELGKSDAIKQLKLDLGALRDQLRATAEDLAVNATAARQAERVLSDKESELARLRSALDERSTLEDVQKIEIVALRMQVETLHGRLAQTGAAVEERRDAAVRALSEKESELARLTTALNERSVLADSQKDEITVLTMQVQTLNERLTQAGEETRAAEDHGDAALRALSEKKSELARLMTALNERSVLADSQKGEIAALTTQVQTLNERLTQAVGETRAVEGRRDAAVRALSENESELARLTTVLNERSVLANSHKAEIAALTMQVQTLDERLTQGGEETKAVEERRDAALRALSEKESELAILTSVLEERSVLVDSQKVENAALRTQGRMLNERLIQAGKEARAVEEHRDVERSELKAATQNLMEERSKFENFHRHVTDLLQQLTAQRTDDEVLNRRAREDVENRLIEQSRLLNEGESELTHLRGEIEIARKAEDDLRIAIIEIDGRANAAIQNLNAEKAQLQAALDRAHGERARLVHELADLKRRQTDEARAAERVDNATLLPERVSDIVAERARRSVSGRLPQIAKS